MIMLLDTTRLGDLFWRSYYVPYVFYPDLRRPLYISRIERDYAYNMFYFHNSTQLQIRHMNIYGKESRKEKIGWNDVFVGILQFKYQVQPFSWVFGTYCLQCVKFFSFIFILTNIIWLLNKAASSKKNKLSKMIWYQK